MSLRAANSPVPGLPKARDEKRRAAPLHACRGGASQAPRGERAASPAAQAAIRAAAWAGKGSGTRTTAPVPMGRTSRACSRGRKPRHRERRGRKAGQPRGFACRAWGCKTRTACLQRKTRRQPGAWERCQERTRGDCISGTLRRPRGVAGWYEAQGDRRAGCMTGAAGTPRTYRARLWRGTVAQPPGLDRHERLQHSTMSLRVDSMKATTSARSGAGTANLSSVACRWRMNVSQSAALMRMPLCDSFMSRPV